MSKLNQDETLYSRWLNNQLSDEELAQLKASGDDRILNEITRTIDSWSLPELSENHRQKLAEKLAQRKQTKVIPLYKRTWFYAAAACAVVLIVSVLFVKLGAENNLIDGTVLVQCNAGETKTIILPDESEVTLIGQSSIQYDSLSFKNKRHVDLTGMGQFNVTSGEGFQVDYENGQVNVIGTEFSVQTLQDFSTVKCFEGKVSVSSGDQKTILEPGDGVRHHKNENHDAFDFNIANESSASKELAFDNAPLEEVCNSLSITYGLTFEAKDVDFGRKYSGRYPIGSLDTALLMVFRPMQIDYTVEGSTVFLKNNY